MKWSTLTHQGLTRDDGGRSSIKKRTCRAPPILRHPVGRFLSAHLFNGKGPGPFSFSLLPFFGIENVAYFRGGNTVKTFVLYKDYRPVSCYMQLGNGYYTVAGEKGAIKTD